MATRCCLPQQLDTTKLQFNSRSWHFARDDLRSFQIAVPNWYAVGGNKNPNGTERGPGSAATIFASVEHPADKFTRVTWGGKESILVEDGATAVSDPINLVIPKGSKFFVRFFYAGTSAIPVSLGVIQGPGDGLNVGTSLTDLTMGGRLLNNSQGNGFTPAAIIQKTALPSFAILGDSLAYGNFDSQDASGDVGIVARGIGSSFPYLNLACGNDRAVQFVKNHDRRVELAQLASHIVIQYGVNDLSSNRTAEQLLADRSAIAAFFPGKEIIETTVTPWTTSTDYFMTTINQKPKPSEPNRIAANNAIRAGRPGIRSYFDVAAAVETSVNSGIIRAPNITPDGVHFRKEGYLLAAAAIKASLSSSK